MSYTEPGVKVRTELANPGVVIQSADQDPVIVGELYEVFSDRAAAVRYNANAGVGAQTFSWPGKKTTSIVDLAGVRADTAEPDDQLRERAKYPLIVRLQDPNSLVKTTLNPLTDIEAVGQSSFRVVEGVAAAVAKVNASTGTSAESNKVRRRAGGLVSLNVKIGDKIRAVLQHAQGGPSTIQGTVTSVTDEEITYSTVNTPVVDGPTITAADADAVTNSGKLDHAAGGFTVGAAIGDRVAIWTEAAEVDDGNGTVSNTITTATGLSLTSADVGRKVSIGSAAGADGAVTNTDGVTNGTNTFTGTGILSSHKGRVIKIGAQYRRIVTAGAGTCTFSGATIGAAAGTTFIIYAPKVRTIATVTGPGTFTYSGGDLATGAQTVIPVILHTRVLRDVTVVNSDSEITYSGSAVTSTTGFLLNLPFDLYKADTVYTVFADFQVLVTYRALDVTKVAGVRVASPEDVTSVGSVSKFNPLLFAASQTLKAMGTNDRNVLLVAVNPWQHMITPSGLPEDRDDSQAYAKALSTIANDPQAYYTVPLSKSSTVRDAFAAHVVAMSTPDEKRERITYLSYNLPMGTVESTTGGIEPGLGGGNKKILDVGQGFIADHGVTPGMVVVITAPAAYAGSYEVDPATTDDELVLLGSNWTQTLEFTVANGNFNAVSGQVTSVTTDVWKDVDVGDWIKSGSNFRRVSAKVNNQTLAYLGGVLAGTGQAVSIIRSSLPPNEPVEYYVDPLTKTEQAEMLKGISQSRGLFRVVHVWPDQAEFVTGVDGSGNDVKEFLDGYYVAAMEAGRDSVIPPQRSSTGSALAGIAGLKNSNTYFETSHLNTIADGGWTIFVQPTPNGSVECRHLLSTDRSSIKRQEVSVTKNVDNMAKVIRNSLKTSMNDDKGRKNVTRKFLDALMLPVQGIFRFFVGNDGGAGDGGQLVVGPNGEAPFVIKAIEADPDFIDQIDIVSSATVPVPANTIDVTFQI